MWGSGFDSLNNFVEKVKSAADQLSLDNLQKSEGNDRESKSENIATSEKTNHDALNQVHSPSASVGTNSSPIVVVHKPRNPIRANASSPLNMNNKQSQDKQQDNNIELRKALKERDEALDTLNDNKLQIKNLKTIIDELKKQIEDAKNTNSINLGEQNKLRLSVDSLESLVTSYRSQIACKQDEIEDIIQLNTKLTNEIDELRKMNGSLMDNKNDHNHHGNGNNNDKGGKKGKKGKNNNYNNNNNNSGNNKPSVKDTGNIASLEEEVKKMKDELSATKTKHETLVQEFEGRIKIVSDKLILSKNTNDKNTKEYEEKIQSLRSSHVIKLKEVDDDFAKQIQVLKDKETAMKKSIESTQKCKELQQDEKLNEITKKLEEVVISSKKLEETIVEKDELILRLQQNMDENEKQINAKDESIQTLSIKTRDVMKKLVEARERVQELENVQTASIDTAEKSAQSKESELISLKLKFDAVEKSLVDQKSTNTSLNSKYIDIQKKLEESQFLVENKIAIIDTLEKNTEDNNTQLEKLEANLAANISKNKELSEELLNKEKSSKMIRKELDQLKENSQHELAEREKEYEKLTQTLIEEKDALESQINLMTDSSQVLDDYKKRAQAAMKTANSDIHKLNLEKVDLESNIVKLEDEIKSLNEKLSEVTVKEEKISSTQASFEKLNKKMTEDMKTMKDEIDPLRKTCDELNALIITKDTHLNQIQLDLEVARREAKEAVEALQHWKELNQKENVINQSLNSSMNKLLLKDIDNDDGSSDLNVSVDEDNNITSQKLQQQHQQDFNNKGDITIDRMNTNSFGSLISMDMNEDEFETSGGDADLNSQEMKFTKGTLIFVEELKSRLLHLKKMIGVKEHEISEVTRHLLKEKNQRVQLEQRVDELSTFIDRTRKQNGDSEFSSEGTGMEYMRNVVHGFMCSTDTAEKMRLVPVISTIMKYTPSQQRAIAAAIDTNESNMIPGESSLISVFEKYMK